MDTQKSNLTKTLLESPLEPGYYKDHEAPGLALRVQDTKTRGRTKSWVQRVEINGQETNLGHGCWPEVSLEEARRRVWDFLDEIAAGRDPRLKNVPTVREMFVRIIAERSESEKIWRSEGTRKRWRHNVDTHINPVIGHLKVTKVMSADILDCIRSLVGKHPETGRQVLSHLREMCRQVRAENLRGDDPTEVVAAALGPIHPRSRNRHTQALPYQQVAEALQRVRESGAHWSTKAVCEMMALTGARQNEVRGARWEEIDLDTATWTVPAHRAKESRTHRIPLSEPALAVLEDAWERTGGVGLVFPSAAGQSISNATVRKLLKTLWIPCRPHGFRASYRTFMHENGVPDEVAELALGHTHKGVPSGIDLLEERRTVAKQWGYYLTRDTGLDHPSPLSPA
ncbi:MAG: tyrosine-type recombinase/integrase [bacterium]|nr:tyrosine-type recombinase/integrase [bacterium]MDE0600171.1 tyrosine-type recombinase/integrase [bacterium]